MKILPLSFKTPEQNLAFEEWYFNQFKEETLRIWINPKSVVVGKHQNALAEVDLNYCLKNDIPVIRRISGGGTVYHDHGNINFSFFRFTEKDKLIDYVQNLDLIKSSLNSLGYDVHMSERHDLFLGDFKISGNAQHIKRGRALHHGTILYSADLDALSKGIKRTHGTFQDKGVKSVRSPILNLRNNVDHGVTSKFQNLLLESLNLETMKDYGSFDSELKRLVDEKYKTESWNFGYSPKYKFINEMGSWKITMDVERGGIIENLSIWNGSEQEKELENLLRGEKHFYSVISELLKESNIGMKKDLLMSLLF